MKETASCASVAGLCAAVGPAREAVQSRATKNSSGENPAAGVQHEPMMRPGIVTSAVAENAQMKERSNAETGISDAPHQYADTYLTLGRAGSSCSSCNDSAGDAVRPVSANTEQDGQSAVQRIKVRQPRRAAAKLDRVALKKTWDGTKSKQRKDRATDADKLSAAVWHAAEAQGLAVSLNLGLAREVLLTHCDQPARRMMKSLSRHLSAVGLGKIPYAFSFELTPVGATDRLHLHGVIDTSGLTSGDLDRLSTALRKAASEATGAIGGQRQLDMKPLPSAAGWADYILKDMGRTSRLLGVENPIMISKTMRRLAREYFERLRCDASINTERTNNNEVERTQELSKRCRGYTLAA
jgi:hypothetical protein